MSENEKLALIEGLLYINGDEGVSINEIAMLLETSLSEAQDLVDKLKQSYIDNSSRGLLIKSFADKYRLTTKKEYYDFYLKYSSTKLEAKLSQAALETLAIIAYRGPISRPEIEELRGVNCDTVIQKLKARELIIEDGKSEIAGKPWNYKVTEEFLKLFNLKSLSDLPSMQQFSKDEDNENGELFQ